LHEDGSTVHRAISVRQVLAEKKITNTWPRSALTRSCPVILLYLPKFEKLSWRKHLYSVEDTHKMVEVLGASSQNDFRGCFEGWNGGMERCVASDGVFFFWRRAPQQKLRTHRSLKAYCAILAIRRIERWSAFHFSK
jgi:hypothetical protein